MILVKKVNSKIDKTIKYVFETEDLAIVEFSYIDNGTGKDIICTPCQTMCNQKCTFCHLTDYIGKIKLSDLKSSQIVQGINLIVGDLKSSHDISIGHPSDRPLLISYMGCGEAMDNIINVLDSMSILMRTYRNIRFGLATMLPKSKWPNFFQMTKAVKENKIPLKIHLSLHFTDDNSRFKWMPSALDIKSSISALEFYRSMTGNPTEVHYTVMDGINDSDKNMYDLETLISVGTTIKFMRYSEKESLPDVSRTSLDKVNKMASYLNSTGLTAEYYEPPGDSIGSSCGVFLLDYLPKNVES